MFEIKGNDAHQSLLLTMASRCERFKSAQTHAIDIMENGYTVDASINETRKKTRTIITRTTLS